MGTTTAKLQAIADSKAAIKAAIARKGVKVGSAPLSDYAVKIESIEAVQTSLGTDLEAIYNQYSEEVNRSVVQIANMQYNGTTIFPAVTGLTKIITSDGQTYTTFPVTHTWDSSKDILDSGCPYMTRWFVVCGISANDCIQLLKYDECLFTTVVSLYLNELTLTYSLFYAFYMLMFLHIKSIEIEDVRSLFDVCKFLKQVPYFDTSGVSSFSSMLHANGALERVPEFDTSNAYELDYLFASCSSLRTLPALNTSKVMYLQDMCNGCTNLMILPPLSFPVAVLAQAAFANCTSLNYVHSLDLHNCQNVGSLFYSCSSLKVVESLDISSALPFSDYLFYGCSSLTYIRFTGIIPISLDFSSCTELTVDSLMSAINALKDLTGETSKTLSLGSTNLNKLSDEQKAIATAKNWVLN